MSQTKFEWLKFLLPLVLVLLPLGQFLLKEWYEPDTRYGTAGAYLSSTLAVSTLELLNYGKSKDENITFTASFDDPLTQIGTGKIATSFHTSAGGIGEKFVTGTINKLVPNEKVSVFFILAPSSPRANYTSFIQSIKSDHGLITTGVPTLRVLPYYLRVLVFSIPAFLLAYYLAQWQNRNVAAQLCEAMELGYSAAQEGISEEQLNIKVEEKNKAIPYIRRGRKHLPILCAQAAFAAAKKTLIHTEG
jgi:hypothetical protein